MPQFSKHGEKTDSRELVVNPKPEFQNGYQGNGSGTSEDEETNFKIDVLTGRHQGTLPRSAFLGRVVDG